MREGGGIPAMALGEMSGAFSCDWEHWLPDPLAQALADLASAKAGQVVVGNCQLSPSPQNSGAEAGGRNPEEAGAANR